MKHMAKLDASSVRFGEFWRGVAADLGNSRIKVSQSACSIREFVDKDSDCKSYLYELIGKSYKLSKCQHLESPLSLGLVLDLLGETAFRLQGDQRDDLFDIELLEEIAWHISSRYSSQISFILAQHKNQNSSINETSPRGQVVSFPNYKIRRSNRTL